jgi:SAM-dependent methyltransferase
MAIADSSSYRDHRRVLPQHMAALTLLQGRLSVPTTDHLSWLDLACGRGQIILFLDENLSAEARSRIEYWGYDIHQESTRETARTAGQLGLARIESHVGDLANFNRVLPPNVQFDFITLTNTVHEILPARFALLLIDALKRLTTNGTLFIYDMERIAPPELGAVPWRRDDIRRIVLKVISELGVLNYRPEVPTWSHSSTTGWSVQIDRRYLETEPDQYEARLTAAVAATEQEISDVVRDRLCECRSALEALTTYGAETSEEEGDKERLLFEFWALERASRTTT